MSRNNPQNPPQNPQLLWLRCFLVTLIFYTFFRLQFSLWNWDLLAFEQVNKVSEAFLTGLRFDVAGLSFVFLLSWILISILPQLTKLWLAFSVLLQSLFFIIQGIEPEMIHFNNRRFSLQQWGLYSQAQGKFLSFLETYWILALSTTVLLGLFILFISKILKSPLNNSMGFSGRSLIGLFGLVALIVGSRGGLQSKPIHVNSAQISSQPVLNLMALNPTFSFFRTIKEPAFPRFSYFDSRAELLNYLPGSSGGSQASQMEGLRLTQPQNVIVIILESFSYEFTGSGGYTPFLDELSEKSFSVAGIANARRSIEGIGAILGGIPHLMNQPFINSSFSTNEFYGLGSILKSKGYTTVFAHGADKGSMYFDQFAKKAGFDTHLSQAEYPESSDRDGTWGIWDLPFFKWTVGEVSRRAQPFGLALFSLSSHHPFKIPPEYEGKFKKGNSEIHESIQYTDFALKEFFKSAEEQSWYKNTLFIVTADHTFKPAKLAYQNPVGDYVVPIIIFHPQVDLSQFKHPQLASQVDLLPTVLDFMGWEFSSINPLGRSLFKTTGHYTVVKTGSEYLLFDGEFILRKALDREEYQLFDHSDWGLKAEIKSDEKLSRIKKMQAYLQYFGDGMWDNRLYYGDQGE